MFIPITWPFWFSNGPPLLPEFILASVCIRPVIVPCSVSIVLSNPLIIPWVTDLCRSSPSGLPIATAISPVVTSSLLPNSAGVNPVLLTFTIAISNWGSYQATLPGDVVPSLNNTFTVFAWPSDITCEFVNMYPFASTIIPVPTPSDSVGIANLLFVLIVVVVIPTTEGIAFSVTAWYTFWLFPTSFTTISEVVLELLGIIFFTTTTVNNELNTEHIIATITTNPMPLLRDIISLLSY